uniref:Uncharacterized protein n=1 Tax=Opuntia streptacantha TaxID=393608 RepID=A0A7C8ZRS5_OPUST
MLIPLCIIFHSFLKNIHCLAFNKRIKIKRKRSPRFPVLCGHTLCSNPSQRTGIPQPWWLCTNPLRWHPMCFCSLLSLWKVQRLFMGRISNHSNALAKDCVKDPKESITINILCTSFPPCLQSKDLS